jgi:hypothetical protein
MDPALRIGVTGHRRLAEEAVVEAAVAAVLERLLSTRASVVVVSPLAEGADRLVARCVLARPGSSLEVLLPLPIEDYLTDFGSAPSRAEFLAMVERASSVTVLAGSEPSRVAAYERVGRAVVDGCDVLLALWDGQPGAGRGGTDEIVHYARGRGVRVEVVAVRRGV